jgi:DNA-binding transcriptional ArsR family regulator
MAIDKSGTNVPESILEIDKVIHEPARLMIMANLYVVESADFVFLIRQTGLTWGNLSAHLSKLEAAGYVAIEKEFLNKRPHTMLQLTKEGRTAFNEYREHISHVLKDLED